MQVLAVQLLLFMMIIEMQKTQLNSFQDFMLVEDTWYASSSKLRSKIDLSIIALVMISFSDTVTYLLMSSKASTPPLLAVLEAARQRDHLKRARASLAYMKHLHNKKDATTSGGSSASTPTVPSVSDLPAAPRAESSASSTKGRRLPVSL